MIKLSPIRKFTKEKYMDLIGKSIEKSTNGKCIIIFFGSILTEDFNKTSDIDVAIFCKNPISSKELIKIEEEFENLPILRDIDLIDIRKVKNINFLQNILKGRIWKNIPELWKDLEKHIESLKK